MTKIELLEQFDKEHQGTYTLDDLALLIVEAYNLGEESEYEAIQRVRELHSPVFHCSDCTAEVCDECDSHRHDNMSWQIKYPCDTIKALDGEQ